MNYMKEVAQMLGVELEENFRLKEGDGLFKISENGLYRKIPNENIWGCTNYEATILMDILNGRYTVTKKPKPILDEVEKEYLSNVIKPFRDKVSHICKRESANTGMEWLQVGIKADVNLDFPNFEKGTMYKGMELGKEYSLEDLGL